MKLSKNIFTFLILMSATLSAQEYEKPQTPDSSVVKITKLGIGVKAGLNFATVSKGDLKNAPDARSSFYFGVNYEIPIIKDVFSVQPELIYSRQGFEKKYNFLEERHTSRYKVDYISVPIIARYYVVRGFSLEAGPQFSYKVGSHFDRDESDSELEVLSKPNDIDFGFILGLTFQFESGFFVSGRYNRGFMEIIDNSDAKNTVIQLGVGYKF